MARRRRGPDDPLPSNPSAGAVVAGLFGTLDHLIVNKPRPVTEISEEYHEPWATTDGLTVEGLEDRPERPEPPDTTGARL
jgi:hypothetical protein